MKLGRALGGLGAAAVTLSGKYIDDEILQQRQQAFLDMQHAQRVKTESWEQSEDVQGPRLMNERRALAMRSEESLRGKENEAASPSLRQSRIDSENSFLEGTSQARINAENAITEGTAGTKLDAERTRRLVMDPMDVRKAGAIADEQYGAQAKHSDRLKSAFDRLPDGVKAQAKQISEELKDINKAIVEAQAQGTWDPAGNKGQSDLAVTKAALQARLHSILDPSAGKDPLGLFSAEAPGGTRSTDGASDEKKPTKGRRTREERLEELGPAPTEPDPADFRARRAALLNRQTGASDDPELQSMAGQVKELLRSGRAVEANNLIAKIEKLKTERYGR